MGISIGSARQALRPRQETLAQFLDKRKVLMELVGEEKRIRRCLAR